MRNDFGMENMDPEEDDMYQDFNVDEDDEDMEDDEDDEE